MHDLRFAFRQLARSPGVTLVVTLTLALGIGANATVLCWMRSLVSRPLPGVAHQERLVALVSNQGGGNVSLPDLQDFERLGDVFDGAFASMTTPASLTVGERSQWIEAQVVSADFFAVLGVHPLLGRTFRPEEDHLPGGNPVLVISERLWRGSFAAAPDIIGRVVNLNRHPFTIVGVVPESFRGTVPPAVFDAWAPLSMIWEVRNQGRYFLTSRSARGWHNLARLRPGVSVAQAHAAVEAVNARLRAEYPETNREARHRVVPLSQCPWGGQTILGPVMQLLLVVSASVLLIVAANVSSLFLARAADRRKEMAIRMAAGARPSRLIRQLLTESVLLALCGGFAGILLARWAVASIPLFAPAVPLQLDFDFDLDATTLGLTLLLTIATGVAFGIAPALHATRVNLNETLKQGGRGASGAGASHARMRGALVIAEVALALVLLVGAGLCRKGLERARGVDIGLEPGRVLTAGLQIGMNGYNPETGPAFYRELRQRLAALPGVEEAALSSWFPLGLAGCKGWDVNVEGHVRQPEEDLTCEYAILSPRYFAVMQIPLVAGRDFTDQDDAGAPDVAIINETLARRFWPDQDPIGRSFSTGRRARTVVGVAKTGKYNRVDEAPRPFFYLPYLQGVPDLDLGICVRTAVDAENAGTAGPAAFANALGQAVHDLDPDVELRHVVPLRVHVQAVFFGQRMASLLLVVLGTIALALASMGVYAVIAHAVIQRTSEFGLRMALGATSQGVLRLVIRQGFMLALLGVAIGLTLALAVTRLLSGFLFGVSPFDAGTFTGVPLLLLLVALVACLLPARRATRVDPVEALRSQ